MSIAGVDSGVAYRDAALDGLRGLAALAVVSTHMVIWLGLLPWQPLGSMGVVVFFVLSGYLIARICAGQPPTARSWVGFVRRRAVRLGPALLGLVAGGGALLVVAGGLPLRDVLEDGLWVLLQMRAFDMAFGDASVTTFDPTWSLTVEWVFYLLFPAIFFLLRRAGISEQQVSRCLMITAGVLYVIGVCLPDKVFYLLPVANLGAMAAGATMALWHRARSPHAVDSARSLMALVVICLFTVLPGDVLSWGWKLSVFPATVAATLVVIHGCMSGNRVARTLAAKPLALIGIRAYSLYLWHGPALWLVWFNTRDWDQWSRAVVSVPAIALVTVVSFNLLEIPSLLKRPRERAGPAAFFIPGGKARPTMAPSRGRAR